MKSLSLIGYEKRVKGGEGENMLKEIQEAQSLLRETFNLLRNVLRYHRLNKELKDKVSEIKAKVGNVLNELEEIERNLSS